MESRPVKNRFMIGLTFLSGILTINNQIYYDLLMTVIW